MDIKYIDRQIEQENTRHKQEISRIEKAKTNKIELHNRKIALLKSQKERIKQNSKLEEYQKTLDKAIK